MKKGPCLRAAGSISYRGANPFGKRSERIFRKARTPRTTGEYHLCLHGVAHPIKLASKRFCAFPPLSSVCSSCDSLPWFWVLRLINLPWSQPTKRPMRLELVMVQKPCRQQLLQLMHGLRHSQINPRGGPGSGPLTSMET